MLGDTRFRDPPPPVRQSVAEVHKIDPARGDGLQDT